QQFFIDALHPADPASMHRLEADRRNLSCILQAPIDRVGQLFQALPHCNRMIRYRYDQLLALRANLDKASTASRTNPFHAAARQLALVGHVKQTVLKTGRTEISNEDLHGRSIKSQRKPSLSYCNRTSP